MSAQQQAEAEIRRHLKLQIPRVKQSADLVGADVSDEEVISIFHAEFLTGASQVLRWLIQNDGNKKLTPQILERAVMTVAKEHGLHAE